MRVADDKFDEIDRLLGYAMEQCVDVEGFDAGPLLARARGEEISAVARQAVDAHLDRCLHCRVFEAEYSETYAAQIAQPDAQSTAACDRLAQLMAASGPHVAEASQAHPEPEEPLLSKLMRLVQSNFAIPSGLVLAAVVVLFVMPVQSSPPPPFESTPVRGMIARTMGVTQASPDEGPLRFSPTGHFQVTLRLKDEVEVQDAFPKIMGFSVQNGRLRTIPNSFIPHDISEANWASLQVDMEVGKVFEGQEGVQRLLFASTREHTADELQEMDLEEALELQGVAWIEQKIVIVP